MKALALALALVLALGARQQTCSPLAPLNPSRANCRARAQLLRPHHPRHLRRIQQRSPKPRNKKAARVHSSFRL